MSITRTLQRAARSPQGCSAKPIAVQLTVEERQRVEQLAQTEQRTLAATARLLVLRGLKAMEAA